VERLDRISPVISIAVFFKAGRKAIASGFAFRLVLQCTQLREKRAGDTNWPY
jgi:hypothetical protein